MVRGIVINDVGEVLLMKMSFPWSDGPVWIAPGGGLGPGETEVEALRRELQEETGRTDLQIGPQVWERRFVVEHEARVIYAHERYFLVRTDRFTPDTQRLEDQELEWFKGFRWWRVDELVRSSEPSSPDTLPSLVARITDGLDSA